MATLFTENDAKDIVMTCPDESQEYPKPSAMYDSKGKRLYAYVTLIMLGDAYIPGALVLAKSIRSAGSDADLVVLVTPDVSAEGKKALQKFFDRVIDINYVRVPNWRTKKQKNREYLNLVFTKFHVFTLTEYKKILLIDADAVVLKYPDHLFTLNAPAGCYLEDKDHIITYDAKGNYILPDTKSFKWYETMCKCCGHGKLIPKNMTDKILKDRSNSGIGGGLMLLEPKVGEFDDIILDVSRGKNKFMVENRLIWPEQQYLSLRYSGKWHGINPKFFGLQGYPHWKALFGLQYGGDKPFTTSSKMDISIRLQFPDYVLFHDIYYSILQENPEFYDIKTFEDSLKMNKLFIGNRKISRSTTGDTNINKKTVSNAFNVPENRIRDHLMRYYFTQKSSQFRPSFVEPLYKNIEKHDYVTPIKNLANYIGAKSYYHNLYSKLEPGAQLGDINDTIDAELMLLEYIKCRPLMFIITVWPIAEKYTNDIRKKLENDGDVCYEKKIKLSKNALHSLMFWMYDEFTFTERLKFTEKKLEYINATDTDNTVTFFFFDNIKHQKISGQGSRYKREVRDSIVNLMGDKTIRGNDLIHINDMFYQTIEYSQMILNENTLKFLHNQILSRLTIDQFSYSHLMMQTFRKWVYRNISQEKIARLIILSGFILFIHGIRNSRDMDGLIAPIDNPVPDEKIFEDKIFRDLQNKSTKLFFADIAIEGSKNWKQSWTDMNNKIIEQFGISNVTELATNPRYHFYFGGLKFYLPEHEIIRKIIRNRPQDHIDLIMMNTLAPVLLGDYVTFDKGNMKYKKGIKYIDENDIKYNNEDILKYKYLKSDIKNASTTEEFKKYFNK